MSNKFALDTMSDGYDFWVILNEEFMSNNFYIGLTSWWFEFLRNADLRTEFDVKQPHLWMKMCDCCMCCTCCQYETRSKFLPCFHWCPGSPFHVGVQDRVNPNNVRCYGPGLDSKNVQANKPATFTVDATEAGQAPLDATYTTPDGT